MKPTIKTKTLLMLVSFALINFSLLAQDGGTPTTGGSLDKSRFNRWSVGVNIGHIRGYTDMQVYDFYPVFKDHNENSIGGGAILAWSISNVFSVRGQFMMGGLKGTKRIFTDTVTGRTNYKTSGTNRVMHPFSRYYKTPLMEMSVQGVMNISNLAFSAKTIGKQRKIGMYVFIGHGLVMFDTKSYNISSDKELDPSKTKYGADTGLSGKTTEAITPVGMGIKYKINKKIDFGLEIATRRANTDKLDGHALGSSVDYYHYISLGAFYKFGKGTDGEALEWINPMEVMYNDIQETKAKIAGLTNDKDGDGVADIMDKDNSTPEGIKVYGDGTTVDQDRDGVADIKDTDPFTMIGAKVDENGKEMDSDGDGVADGLDQEANTAKGSLVDVHGRAIEMKAGGGGMVSGTGSGAVYFPPIFFTTGQSTITSVYYDKLATIARELKANPNISIVIVGHADKNGKDDANMKLGLKRAEAVKDHLIKHYGISADRMTTESKGETEALAISLLQMNRRVDIRMK